MGTWGTAIKDSDAFADIYSEFFDLYNNGGKPEVISQKISDENWEMLEIEEEKHSFWFALALCQWETKSLDEIVLTKVEQIIKSDEDLNLWLDLGANDSDIKKRKIALDKFLEKLKSDKPRAKSRRKKKLKTPIFSTGDCLVFRMENGNYGGAVVLATDSNPETAYNLVATTKLNICSKPMISDFKNAEILLCNFGSWDERPHINWIMPDLFHKDYSEIFEVVGKLNIEIKYDVKNTLGKGYLFHPSYTAGWMMVNAIEQQILSEIAKQKPSKIMTVNQLIKKKKWWNIS